ncbi:MAG: VWA containing CoxE family protein [Rickettsiales bacterium]|nr:VWA containing CoxE family protein [Rickettsiales bacterium]
MFIDFLFSLRRHGVPVATQQWLALHRALQDGLIADAEELYGLGRAILVPSEARFDSYDLAFLETFRELEAADLKQAIADWLENPLPLPDLSPEAFERLTGMSLEELQRRFEEILEQQKERHDGGSRWVGTGGTSPWGHSGRHPTGIRVGGEGRSRSAVQVAGERRFRDFRSDATLDVRQFKLALRTLRSLAREGREELDLDETIDETGRQAGEIELVFRKERRNTVRLLLLMDAGGSMTPFARLVDRLFTAASELGHWRSFDHYFFHNIVYSRVYSSIERLQSAPTAELFRAHPRETRVVFVGDACMAPWELMAAGGALSLRQHNPSSGLDWLMRFREHFPSIVWLNPERPRYWGHETISTIARLIPMFPLTLEGLREAVEQLQRSGELAAPSAR